MSQCKRFEEQGLERLERGIPLDEHDEHCSDCRAARAAYDRLKLAMAESDPSEDPPSRWQEGVWAEIARQDRWRR